MTQPLFESPMAFDSSLSDENLKKTSLKQRIEQVSAASEDTGLAKALVNFVKQGSQNLLNSLLQ